MNISFIPLCEPTIHGNEWFYVKKCLDDHVISSVGGYVERFEKVFAAYLKGDHPSPLFAVACVNGTAALHVALLISGVQSNEEVLMPALTFVAPANAIRYVGAWPVFIDVELRTGQMDVEKLHDFIRKKCEIRGGRLVNRVTQRIIASILPVHILGHPVDMEPLVALAKKYHLVVIEDAAQSLGALYKNKKVGTWGDIASFSFNGNKVITTGGGGMVVTADPLLAKKARYYTTQAKDDPQEFIHHEIGYNYRLTNIQAAIGLAQMEYLNDHLTMKRRLANFYDESLIKVEGIKPFGKSLDAVSSHWLYTVVVDKDSYGMDSRELLFRLREKKIEARPLWHPLHLLKPFRSCYAHQIEVAEYLYRHSLSLPSSVGLKMEEQKRVVEAIRGC